MPCDKFGIEISLGEPLATNHRRQEVKVRRRSDEMRLAKRIAKAGQGAMAIAVPTDDLRDQRIICIVTSSPSQTPVSTLR